MLTSYFILIFCSRLFILTAKIATHMQIRINVNWISQCSSEHCSIPIMDGLSPFVIIKFMKMTQLIRKMQIPCLTNWKWPRSLITICFNSNSSLSWSAEKPVINCFPPMSIVCRLFSLLPSVYFVSTEFLRVITSDNFSHDPWSEKESLVICELLAY